MLMYDIIDRKRNKNALSEDEIGFVVRSFTTGEIPDYQMSALLMAICINGMTPEETTWLTKAMVESGDTVDLSSIAGIKVDKHSTGGVGDKTSLIVAPIVAACGVPVAKMSGRGLGHTGGTIDKLESIPGFCTSITMDEFVQNVNSIGISIVDKIGNIAPADKKIYALRDVTATVQSIPLIASSIMSKKIASGADKIVLDVKYGNGAFMKTSADAAQLARRMCEIGERAGRRTVALVTGMDNPLGRNIGNILEVKEVMSVLSGETEGLEDLLEVCVELAAYMLQLAGKGPVEECRYMVKEVLESGRAFAKFKEFVERQHGRWSEIEGDKNPHISKFSKSILASQSGYVSRIEALDIGIASVVLGAGRKTKESVIDFGAGITLEKKAGDYVAKGDVVAVLYTSDEESFSTAADIVLKAYEYSEVASALVELIEEVIL